MEVQFAKEGLAFDGDGPATSMLWLAVPAAAGEFELAHIKSRQREDIALAT